MAFKTLARSRRFSRAITGRNFNRLIVAAIILPCILNSQGNPPAWSYSPMNTVGVFQGFVFDFRRTRERFAEITVTAIIDGKECVKRSKVATPPNPDPDHPDLQVNPQKYGRFPMDLGKAGLAVVVKRIQISLGGFASDKQEVDPGVFYEMTAESKLISDVEGSNRK